MHPHNPIFIASARLSLFSASDDGMHVELAPEDGTTAAEQLTGPVISFRGEENGVIHVLLHFPDQDVALPLSELKRAIALAEEEVHPESHFTYPRNP